MSITEIEFQAPPRSRARRYAAIEGRSQWQLTWRRLRGDKVAVAAMIAIIVMVAGHRRPGDRRASSITRRTSAYPNTGENAVGGQTLP